MALSSALDFYVFSRDRYYGEDSLNDVRRDLLLSAKLGGFELVTHSSGGNKVALGVKRRLVLTCARNRCYKGGKTQIQPHGNVLTPDISIHGTVFSNRKQYNNPDSTAPDYLVRKTSTGHPVEDDQRCPFQVAIELREENLWYLCRGRRHSNKADVCCTHMWHPKLDSDQICNLSVRYATVEQKRELNRYSKCHLSTSVSANLLSSISDFRWLPSQVRYCCSKEDQLLTSVSYNVSSADALLAYLRGRDDVSFVILTDTEDGLVVTTSKSISCAYAVSRAK